MIFWLNSLLGLALGLFLFPTTIAVASSNNTGSLANARYLHTATLLPDGKVLMVGGNNSSGNLSGAELYDPASGTFSTTGSLSTARREHTATLLANGKVLIAGGFGTTTPLNSAELYDPTTGTFTATGNLVTARSLHTATLLSNGKVLFTGGFGGSANLGSAELYDPTTGTFSATGNLANARSYHTATLLANGKVLVIGGLNSGNYLADTELYNPATGTFTATGNLTVGRSYHTALLLPNGTVLVAGGSNGNALAGAELYDASSGTFANTGSLNTARYFQAASLLPDGRVLLSGGFNGTNPLISTELYDASSGTFANSANLVTARSRHSAIQLANGRVLLVAGVGSSPLAGAELFEATSGSFSSPANFMTTARYSHTATLLPNGKVLIAGGVNSGTALNSANLYDPATRTFSATGNLITARYKHTATLLANGKVLIVGGNDNPNFLATAELYDPVTGTFSTTGSLATARQNHTATLLANGKVLISGGTDNSTTLTANELYDPNTGTFSATGSLAIRRHQHSATLLTNGKVLIAGGFNGTFISASELYDPNTGTFSDTAGLNYARTVHTATLLPSGKVLIAGGRNIDTNFTITEQYDPATGTFSSGGNLIIGRFEHTATLLPSGKVLITGGRVNYFSSSLSSAELYDPNNGSSVIISISMTQRALHTATLLPNHKVLVAGGISISAKESGDLFDLGLGYPASNQPIITNLADSLIIGQSITVAGAGFNGVSETSGGNTSSSATNYPLLKLHRFDNEQTSFITVTNRTLTLPDNAATGDFTTVVLPDLARGYYLTTVYVNGIPSPAKIVNIVQNSSTTVTGTPNPSIYGQRVTLTATVTTGTGSPSGTVQFYHNGTALGSAVNLSGGGATLVTSTLPVATNLITATYSGDSNFGSSTSPVYSQSITAGAPAILTITAGNNQSTAINSAFGSSLVVKLTDSGGNPISGTSITFTPPASGAGAVIAGGNSGISDASGLVIKTAMANSTAGSYIVGVSAGGLSGSFNLTNIATTSTATGTVKLLGSTVRVASTLPGDGLNSPKLIATGTTPSATANSGTVEFTIGGTKGIPANATGIFGILTNVGCSGGANFRFWTGNAVPNAANLNVPGANPALNLSTNFIAPLSEGKVKLGLGSGSAVSCGYVVDVSGYSTAPNASSDRVTLLTNTVRVASTLVGDGLNSPKLTATASVPSASVDSGTVEFTIGGSNNIPLNSKGIIGVLTNVGCTGGGNFRFFTGSAVPNAANLNVPGALASLNLSTGFIAALDSSGKLKLGLGSGASVTCGYVMEVVGYINPADGGGNNLTLLGSTMRVASTQSGDGLNSPKLTATNATPTNSNPGTVEFTLGGSFSIPSEAKGVLGVLVNVGCSGGGNFRFWTGTSVPNAANLNVPGAFPSLNLSTGFTASLDATGKLKLGLGSGTNVTCGYVTDVVGYLS